MPYSVALNPSPLFVDSRYFGDVSLEDIRQTNLQIVQLFDMSKAEKLILVTDVSDVQSQPIQVGQIWSSAKQVAYHPKLERWVIVGIHNPVLKFIVDMVIKLAKIQYRKFDSREEALAFLTQAVSENK